MNSVPDEALYQELEKQELGTLPHLDLRPRATARPQPLLCLPQPDPQGIQEVTAIPRTSQQEASSAHPGSSEDLGG